MRVYRSRQLKALGIDFQAPRDGDAGYDIHAIADCELAPGERALLPTGLVMEIPPGHVGLIKDRSSLALAGIHCLAGVIDSAYRGEVKILLINLGQRGYPIQAGQKIAQLLVMPVYTEAIEEVSDPGELSASERGAGGFGSTGG